MYTLCSTEKTADQQRIFEKTFLQMLLESNYDDITISELCRRAGLSRRIFYRLFERKSDVLYALLDHTILEEESYEPDESVCTGDLPRFFAFWKEQKDLLLFIDSLRVNGSDSRQQLYCKAAGQAVTRNRLRFDPETEPSEVHAVTFRLAVYDGQNNLLMTTETITLGEPKAAEKPDS